MSDGITDSASDSSDDGLERLAEAAHEAMLRTVARSTDPQPCTAGRAFVAFVIDAVLGFGCLCTSLVCVTIVFEEMLPRAYGVLGDAVRLVVVSAVPLLYSGLDVMAGGTPGKILTRVIIAGPPPLRRAVMRRWAVKGTPFFVAVVFSTLGLASATSRLTAEGRHSEGWSSAAMLCVLVGLSWWLMSSMADAKGQTLVDWMVGTSLSARQKGKGMSGFEPVVGQRVAGVPVDKSARY